MNSAHLQSSCAAHLPEMLSILERMVGINSYTRNPEGVNRLGHITAEAFAPLGFSAETEQAAHPEYGRHLILRRRGAEAGKTIALVSHLDTVFTEQEELRNAFHWRPAGRRIYGPGTNDIKGGTAMIWLMLSALRDTAPQLFAETSWTILLNASEEVKSDDFGDLCVKALPADTRACLVFEGDGALDETFSLVAARKGRATFDIHVSGRGSHAGSSHDRGANAVVQLARIVDEVSRLTDYAAGVTVNVGSISGGTVPNRVPHEAIARLEMRSFSPEIFQRTRDVIMAYAGKGTVASAADGHLCTVTVTIDDETGPWPVNPATERLISLWQETGRDLGFTVAREERGGLSDGNVLWRHFPTIDGLGPRGDNCHCSEHSEDGSKEQEWVDVESFVPKAVLNARCIERLLE
jgi:glutamate carboxypeptidase